MLERPLGTTGLRITQVGFGAWAVGGGGWAYGWGGQDDADSIAAIRQVLGVFGDTTAAVKEQESRIQKVGAQVELNKPAPQVAATNQ